MNINGYLKPIESNIETIEMILDDMKYNAETEQNAALGSYIKRLETLLAAFKAAVRAPPVQLQNQNQEQSYTKTFNEIRF